MINVHRHATRPLPKLVLVNTNENVATYTNITTLAINYKRLVDNTCFCWAVADDVGDYICSYNDFRYLYPEYFI